MARVDLSDGWTVSRSVSDLQNGLNTFLRKRGWRIIGEQTGEVHARQSSWLARIFGPRLSRASWLPKAAVVKFSSGKGGVAVRAKIEETFTPGTMSPQLLKKYRQSLDGWMGELKAELN